MPLEIDRYAPHRDASRRAKSRLVVGLVNNMPDAALETTETQFARLLSVAAGSWPVQLRLTALPEVARGAAGLRHIEDTRYWPIDELLREPLDALIVTGLEPRAPLLSEEPYWDRLGQLIRWAETNTTSSIWSCLAAHAAVEHLDGVRRRRLERKRSGVFAHGILPEHFLLASVKGPLYTPHSRWNELPTDALAAAGYTLLSTSPETGADLFVKPTRRSLFVFFQGHPEYEGTTLLREYRRDVGRFLRGEQCDYPTVPQNYFPEAALKLLSAFEQRALAAPSADLLTEFPLAPVSETLRNAWSEGAHTLYRNWIARLAGERSTQASAADP